MSRTRARLALNILFLPALRDVFPTRVTCHVLPSRVTYHTLSVTRYLSRNTCLALHVTCSRHALPITRYLSRVTCHTLTAAIRYSYHVYNDPQVAREVLETILNVQPKDSGGGSGETRESVVYRLAQEMLDKLPPDFIPHEVRSLKKTCR